MWNYLGRTKHIYKTQYVQIAILNTVIGASIDLGATNRTFVTKYEFENYFLTPTTEEPKLNHWVNAL